MTEHEDLKTVVLPILLIVIKNVAWAFFILFMTPIFGLWFLVPMLSLAVIGYIFYGIIVCGRTET